MSSLARKKLVCIVFLAATFWSPLSFGQSTDEPRSEEIDSDFCILGNSLREAGYLDEAMEAYVAVLSDMDIRITDKQCAADALTDLRNLQTARRDEEAAKAQQRNPYRSAKALAEFGLHDAALESVTNYLEGESEGSNEILAVPSELQYLSGGRWPIWRLLKRWTGTWLQPVLEVIASLLVVIVIIYLLVRSLFSKPKIRIAEFESGAFEEEHFGNYFAQNLYTQLVRMTLGSQRRDLQLVSGPIEAIDLPSEIEAVIPTGEHSWMSPIAWVRAISALVNWIFPVRIVQVTGLLHAAGNRGVGVTVRLVERNRILTGYAFWDQDFDFESEPSEVDVEETLYRLADYVAIWLLFEVREQFKQDQLKLLGTMNWRSYALFRAGYLAEDDRRQLAARALYQRALNHDSQCRAARVNLGLWHVRHDQAELAIEHFKQASEEAVQDDDIDRDSTYYSAVYNLAALQADSGQTEAAISTVNGLLTTIDGTLEKIRGRVENYDDPVLEEHVSEIRLGARTMLGGLLVIKGDEKGVAIINEQSDRASVSPGHQYNLGCSYSLLVAYEASKIGPSDREIEQHLSASLFHLKRAFQLSPHLTRQAKFDETLHEVKTRRKSEYEDLVKEFSGANSNSAVETGEQPLAAFTIIGDAHAGALAELGIVTTDDLLKRTTIASDRKNLAHELTISPRIVTKWAHAADLARITGVTTVEVNLLGLAGINGIGELASQNSKLLTDELAALSDAIESDKPPELESVQWWIDQAGNSTLPLVS